MIFGLLTCHRESDAKSGPTNCLHFGIQDTPTGIEILCDGVPHAVNHGKEGPAGKDGRNGSPGSKGEQGDKGEQGPPGNEGRSVKELIKCKITWEGVPNYKLDYQVFTFSDGARESNAIIENTTDAEIYSNSVTWLKEDPRYNQAQLELGNFVFRLTSGGAIVLYRGTGQTSDMTCSHFKQ